MITSTAARSLTTLAIALLVGLAGCSGDDASPAVDAGSTIDASVRTDGGGSDSSTAADARLGVDAGSDVDAASDLDAGLDTDSGSEVDASADVDAGVAALDGGPTGGDAGAATSDAGTDAGPPVDPCGVVSAVWARRFGAGGHDQITAGATSATGTTVFSGRSRNGTIDFGGGPIGEASSTALFVVQVDPAGTHIWSRAFRAGFSSEVHDVAVDSAGNVFVTGAVQGTIDFGGGPLPSISGGAGTTLESFVVSFDSVGVHRWSRRYGPGEADSVTPYGTGGAMVVGEFSGTVSFGGTMFTAGGSSDVFLLTLDSLGMVADVRRFGGTGADWTGALAIDSTGAIVLAGHHGGGIDFGGGSVGTMAGMFVAKLDATRAHVWSRGYAGTQQNPDAVAIDASNAVIVGGQGFDLNLGGGRVPAGAFVAKLNESGTHVWSHGITMPMAAGDFSYTRSVAVDTTGDVVAVGGTTLPFGIGGCVTPDGGIRDGFFVRLAGADGALIEARMLGAGEQDAAEFVSVALGDYFVGGWLGMIAADLGTGLLPPGGDFDGFLVRYTP